MKKSQRTENDEPKRREMSFYLRLTDKRKTPYFSYIRIYFVRSYSHYPEGREVLKR